MKNFDLFQISSDTKEKIFTRFPPEPNGFLHFGHAKSICLNFGIAKEFDGECHLRFDDTNPTTEHMKYVEAIKKDIKWLGFDWKENLFFASDYYEQFYELCIKLIKKDLAYVCDLTEDQIRESRGTVTEPGKNSPFRNRTAKENLDLLERMRLGEFADGICVVRLKIDMSHCNMKMRDPLIYRIRHIEHYRTGNSWCIYPLYDFAHCLSDWIEGITHSLCTLEFENNRELYNWILEACDFCHRPKQMEFARLNLTHTITSKRKLLRLVEDNYVSGWDDPRMPTLAGMRRRGFLPESIREFCDQIGVAKNNSTIEIELFEHIARESLDLISPRVMCVLNPLKVVIENLFLKEKFEIPFWPANHVKNNETHSVSLSNEIFIELEDFMEIPSKGFHRLTLGGEVRLKGVGILKCLSVVKDSNGSVIELRCSLDRNENKKIKGTIHWVDASNFLDIEVRLYDHLFLESKPGESSDSTLNPLSSRVIKAKIEKSLVDTKIGDRFQFMRMGYFICDEDSRPNSLVFNRILALKNSWSPK